MKSKMILYGAGNNCKKICELFEKIGFKDVLIFDSDSSKWGTTLYSYGIMPPQDWNPEWSSYFITVKNSEIQREIRENLHSKYHFEKENEISEINMIINAYLYSPINLINEKYKVNRQETTCFVYRMPLGLGGVESWLEDICNGLIRKYDENIVLLTGKGRRTKYSYCYDFKNWDLLDFQKVKDLIDIYVKINVKTVCINLIDEGFIAAVIVKELIKPSLKIISVIHNSTKEMLDTNADVNTYIDEYCVVSDYIKNEMIERGVSIDKILYMNLPIAVSDSLTRVYSTKENPLKIGYAGRLDGFEKSQKRMDLLFQLLVELGEKKCDFIMSIAGDGPAKKELERLVNDSNVTDRVIFLGQIDRRDIRKFWLEQDVCINMADFEGHSISISEAMANGAVPVVTDVSGVRDDITNKINGYIVSVGNYLAAANCIEELCNKKEMLEIMGKRAHEVIAGKNKLEDHLLFWNSLLN